MLNIVCKKLVRVIVIFDSNIFLLAVPRRNFFCGSFVYFCIVFVMLTRLFIATLWSPAGESADLLTLVCDV